jgi:hypothetical protein
VSDQPELPPLLRAFCSGAIDNAQFHHAQHVEVAFEMLERHSFVDAAAAFARGLRAIAAKAGKPELYNETVTVAFLSMIAEAKEGATSFPELARQAPELMSKAAIGAWYSPERLAADAARRVFLLPDRIGGARP